MTRRLLAMALLAALAGCARLSSPASELPFSAPPVSAPAPTSARDEQTSAATGTPTPTPRATPTAPATARPTPGEPTPGEPRPPDALLTLPDGTQQAGALGSYFYGGAAADSPWLPAHSLPPLEVASGATLRLTAPPLEFVRWSARYAEAADVDASMITPLAAGGEGSVGMTSATLPAPPSGSWVVSVQLYFADDEGDATYYWHVSVP